MNMSEHQTFDTAAHYYDLFELKSQPMYDSMLEILKFHFKKHDVTSVLDFACGTGAQAIPLARKGYQVTACDISTEILRIAQQKAFSEQSIQWRHGDMRSSQFGTFDAAIAMLNAVGYLSASDFITALRNIRQQLAPSGLFIFDNANLGAIRKHGYTPGTIIDAVGEEHGKKFVRLWESTVDLAHGQLTTEWNAYVQEGFLPAEHFKGTWQRQAYTCEELERMLCAEGFRVLAFCDRSGGDFIRRILFPCWSSPSGKHRRQPNKGFKNSRELLRSDSGANSRS